MKPIATAHHHPHTLAAFVRKNAHWAMCLVALAWKAHPRWRLLMLGNRDEAHDRPTADLQAWADRPGVIAGRDLRSGGSWMGASTSGRTAVVTNVRDPAASQHGPSRGQLVADYLSTATTAQAAAEQLQPQARHYPPFNLVLTDAEHCRYLGNHPARATALAAGVHGLSNGALNAPWPKTRRLTGALTQWLGAGHEDMEPLWAALADQTPADDSELPDTGVGLPLERRLATAFITGAQYGTRASTLVGIAYDGSGFIHERRFGPHGVATGRSVEHWPAPQHA